MGKCWYREVEEGVRSRRPGSAKLPAPGERSPAGLVHVQKLVFKKCVSFTSSKFYVAVVLSLVVCPEM